MDTFIQQNCRRCGLNSMSYDQHLVICTACGWMPQGTELLAEEKVERKFMVRISVVAALVFSAMIHTANWGNQATTIIPLKMKQLLGIANTKELLSVVQICTQRKKLPCVASTFEDLTEMKDANASTFAELGHARFKLKNYQGAKTAFEAFFKRGGIHELAAYRLAKIYESESQFEMAVKYYDTALKAKPLSVQVTIVQDYVKLLESKGQIKKAIKLIEQARAKSPTAKYVMAKEFSELKLKLRSRGG